MLEFKENRALSCTKCLKRSQINEHLILDDFGVVNNLRVQAIKLSHRYGTVTTFDHAYVEKTRCLRCSVRATNEEGKVLLQTFFSRVDKVV